MGATVVLTHFDAGEGVSIHAPVMGATIVLGWFEVIHRVSIHAPVMGATFCWNDL